MKPYILFIALIIAPQSSWANLSYYITQSIPGHLSLMFKMTDIHHLLNDDIEPELRKKLKTALEIRQYASEQLNLPENESYTYYADIGRPYVTWNVTAAPEFSLKPKKWCYFIIGCAAYRGYYNEKDALDFAKSVKDEGFDVAVGGATAYSTLGFFNDPVLSTMLPWKDYQLAGIIFHELTHQVLYIKGDTSFNEAYAKTVEIVGVIRWLKDREPELIPEYLAALERAEQFRALLLNARKELEKLYDSELSIEDKRRQKAAIYEGMKQDHEKLVAQWGKPYYQNWFSRPVNNARMISQMTYWHWVPAFLALYLESNMQWPQYYRAAEDIGELDMEKRKKRLQQLLDQNISLAQVLKLITKSN